MAVVFGALVKRASAPFCQALRDFYGRSFFRPNLRSHVMPFSKCSRGRLKNTKYRSTSNFVVIAL
jgi:hypothetical protein